MKRILITNDDGINAAGIIRLAASAAKFGKVTVVAPMTQRSAASHSITLHGDIDIYTSGFPVSGVTAFSSTGTPSDCVRLGILNLMEEKPDIVLSGINFGYNAGSDIQYSATVGAALESVFQGIPAVAFSEGTNDGYVITDMYLEKILEEVLNTRTEYGEIINVNFPACSPEEFKGILRNRTVSSDSVFDDKYNCVPLSDGGRRFTVEGIYHERAAEGTDLRALFDKYISIGTVKNIC